MIDFFKLSDADKLQAAKAQIDSLRETLPKEIYQGSFTLESKLPWKAMIFREILYHRFSDFADATILLYEKGYIIPAFTLTRSLMETSAMMYWLLVKVNEFDEKRDVKAFDDFLMKGLMGDKTGETEISSFNILTAVDHVDKLYTGTRDAYDRLSEFVHPNYSGVMGSYSHSEPEQFTTFLGKQAKLVPAEFGLVPLLITLMNFVEDYNAVGHAIKIVNNSFNSSK